MLGSRALRLRRIGNCSLSAPDQTTASVSDYLAGSGAPGDRRGKMRHCMHLSTAGCIKLGRIGGTATKKCCLRASHYSIAPPTGGCPSILPCLDRLDGWLGRSEPGSVWWALSCASPGRRLAEARITSVEKGWPRPLVHLSPSGGPCPSWENWPAMGSRSNLLNAVKCCQNACRAGLS